MKGPVGTRINLTHGMLFQNPLHVIVVKKNPKKIVHVINGTTFFC